MSSTTPASAPGASAQAAARAHAMAGRKAAHGGNGMGTDQFAQMLLLLSATNDAAPDSHGQGGLLTATHGQTLGTTDNPHGTASLNGTGPGALPDAHPLAALMGWPGAPLPLPLSPKTQPLFGAPPEATLPGATVGATLDLSSGGSPVTAGAPETGTARSGLAGSDSTTPAATATTGSISTASAPGTPALATPVTPTTAAAPDLSGMQRLERPASPDEATLAALARREGGAETAARPAATPTVPGSDVAAASHANGNAAAPANTARPTTAWRSTATGVTTGSVQQQHVQNSLSERLQLRVDVAAPLALRSTVTLDERFTANTASDGSALTGAAVAGSAPSAAGTGAGAGGQPGTGEHAASPHETPPAEPEVDADAPFDGLLAEPEPEENMGTWNAAGLRQASLRVGEAGEDAIDIRLSMNGQELDVAFRTDSADTRAELRQNAGESLSDMLQRSGIRLGDVSVGAQNGQQPGGGQQAQTPPRNAASGDATGDAGTAAGAETPPASTASARPRSDGSRPLDLFV